MKLRVLGFAVVIGFLSFPAQADLISMIGGERENRDPQQTCEVSFAAPAAGYGANGPFRSEKAELEIPGFKDKASIYFPRGAKGKSPVIFLSHGYGPNVAFAYETTITHLVSRGMIVVFGVFPMGGQMENRYNILWSGYELAAAKYADRMDLTRVGFVGHSFGGGANPTMAYQGIVGKGWGSKGAFLMELAPWYTYYLTDAQMREFPPHVIHAVQVYDRDTLNDHRMSVDLYKSMPLAANFYLSVATLTVEGCELQSMHGVPGHKGAAAVKYYGMLRPMDMLADAAFNGNTAALAKLGMSSKRDYAPVSVIKDPAPANSEEFYAFQWSGKMNPRK